MGESRRRKSRALTAAQREERFTTGGRSFDDALKVVLKGGPDSSHEHQADDKREADK